LLTARSREGGECFVLIFKTFVSRIFFGLARKNRSATSTADSFVAGQPLALRLWHIRELDYAFDRSIMAALPPLRLFLAGWLTPNLPQSGGALRIPTRWGRSWHHSNSTIQKTAARFGGAIPGNARP
jgi:hypothetical protein